MLAFVSPRDIYKVVEMGTDTFLASVTAAVAVRIVRKRAMGPLFSTSSWAST
jgi:hypothetical protein